MELQMSLLDLLGLYEEKIILIMMVIATLENQEKEQMITEI